MNRILLQRIRSWFQSPRSLALLAVLGIAVGFGIWIARSYIAAEEHCRQARKAVQEYDFDAAKEHWNAFLAARPNDAEAHFLLARACRRARIEDFAEARHHLDEARRLGWPRLQTALEDLMLSFQEHGTSTEIERTLATRIRSGEANAPLLFEALIRGSIRADRTDKANVWLNAWIERDADNWYPRWWRGALFEYLSKANLAVPDFQLVLQHRPQDEEIRLHLGLMLVQSGYNYKEAREHLETYRHSHPHDPDALVGIAQCLRAERQIESAQTLLEEVIAAHPDHLDALRVRALLALDQGKDDEALKWLRRLEPLAHRSHYFDNLDRLSRLQVVPNHINVFNQLREVSHLMAGILHRKGRHQEAEVYQRRLRQLADDRRAVDQALAELADKPHDAELMYRIATLFLRLEMKEQAAHWLRRVLQERPGDAQARAELAKYSATEN